MCNCIHHILSVSFFINYTKDSQKCAHVRWMEFYIFISRGHHASSTHSYSGSSRMCTIHTHISHVRSTTSMTNCSATLRLFIKVALIVLSWTYQLINWIIVFLRLVVVATCRLLFLFVLNPQRTVCGVITLVYQLSVIVYLVGLVTISVIGSCLCHGLAHFFRNSFSFVTCLVSQLILMDVTEASNSTLPNSNVPVFSIM